jgi:hypothetical protein
VACLPAAVSLLLLEALFMQISGVSLALTWHRRLCLFRVLLWGSLCYRLSPFQALGHCTCIVRTACLFTVHVGGGSSPPLLWSFPSTAISQAFLLLLTGRCCCSCQLPCLFTVHIGSGSSLLFCGVFLSPPLSQASLLLVAGCAPCPRSHQSLSGPPGLFIYSLFTVLGRVPFPQSSALRVPHPLSSMSLLLLFLITQFLFFPWVEVSLSRGLCCSGPGLSVGVPRYHEAHLLRVFPYCQYLWFILVIFTTP